jgi:hypothetical protein
MGMNVRRIHTQQMGSLCFLVYTFSVRKQIPVSESILVLNQDGCLPFFGVRRQVVALHGYESKGMPIRRLVTI